MRGLEYKGDEYDFSPEELSNVIIEDDLLYEHKTVRINYTTYDLRREEETIKPGNHADIMVLADEEGENAHPYWYSRVIGIFHVNATLRTKDEDAEQYDLLWVHWFAREAGKAGWKARRLRRLTLFDLEDEDAFGFIDPKHVIRGVHLIHDDARLYTYYLNM